MRPADRLQAWWNEYTDDLFSLDDYERLTDASRAILDAGDAKVPEGHPNSVRGFYVELPFGLMAHALMEVEREAVVNLTRYES